jgi:hypothetical protein
MMRQNIMVRSINQKTHIPSWVPSIQKLCCHYAVCHVLSKIALAIHRPLFSPSLLSVLYRDDALTCICSTAYNYAWYRTRPLGIDSHSHGERHSAVV